MASDSRQKMVHSAAALMRERGLAGTSFRDVVAHSGAPRGSIYHHFPDGKYQLAEEAVRAAGQAIALLLDRAGYADDPVAALQAFIASWRSGLQASDFRAGCPVVAVATEAPADQPQLTAAAGGAFLAWQTLLADGLHAHGLTPERARRVATLIVAAVEGAVVLARAQRSTAPLDDVAAELELTLRQAISAT